MQAKAQHPQKVADRLGLRLLPLLVGAAIMGGCATQQPLGLGPVQDPATAALAATGMTPVGRLPAGRLMLEDGTVSADDAKAPEPTIVRGNDQMFRMPAARAPVVMEGGSVSLSFEQAPVTDVVHAVLGDILQVPYVINEPIAGSLTVNTHAPLPREQIFAVFESVLLANGLAVVSDAAGVYHVGRPEALRGIAPILGRVGALAPGQSMIIVPLRFIGAGEMAEILRPLAPTESLVRVDATRNLLMLAGSRNQIEGWLDVVSSFDVDMLKGMSVGLFPLQYTSVEEVRVALAAVFGGSVSGAGGVGAATPSAVSQAGGSSAAPAAADLNVSGGPLGSVVRIVAIERLNALLVVSPRAHYIDQARDWIARFDTPRESELEPGIYVYPVQNGTAAHLAGLMSALFGGDFSPSAGTATRRDPGVAPGLSSLSTGSSAGGTTGTGTSSSSSASGTGLRASLGGNTGDVPEAITQFELGPKVRVVADEYNNALLIHAPRSEYRKIEAALRQLDKSPAQVLVEASIIEVTLRDELQYGLQWFFQGGLGGGYAGQGTLSSQGSFNPLVPSGTGAPGEGFSYSIFNASGQLRVLLNLLARKSLLNVISSPSVMVLDNHTAHIQVGDQQPIRSSTSTSTEGGLITSSIQYRDTGVLLSVTPSVNAGGMVSMTIEQEVTDVGEVDSATEQRTFLQRRIGSKVAVRSGETVVLGGLIRDNSTNGKAGLPVLHDVPLLGHLFGTTNKQQVRTELLVMLTPRVMQNDAELQQVGLEMRQRMQGLQQLLQRPVYPNVELEREFTQDVIAPQH